MSWSELLTFAGTAGLLSAVLGQLFAWIGGLVGRRRRARYLALRLAVLLENYSRQCVSDAADTDTWLSSDGHAGEAHFRIRTLPELPVTSEAWEFLRADLSHRVLSIDFERTQQNAAISNEIDVTGETDTNDIIIKTMDAASVAVVLAKDLRYAYGLPQFQPAQDLLADSADWVERLRVKRAEQMEKQAEFNRRMFEAMEARRATSATE